MPDNEVKSNMGELLLSIAIMSPNPRASLIKFSLILVPPLLATLLVLSVFVRSRILRLVPKFVSDYDWANNCSRVVSTSSKKTSFWPLITLIFLLKLKPVTLGTPEGTEEFSRFANNSSARSFSKS